MMVFLKEEMAPYSQIEALYIQSVLQFLGELLGTSKSAPHHFPFLKQNMLDILEI